MLHLPPIRGIEDSSGSYIIMIKSEHDSLFVDIHFQMQMDSLCESGIEWHNLIPTSLEANHL
jgi:hypothetical protein